MREHFKIKGQANNKCHGGSEGTTTMGSRWLRTSLFPKLFALLAFLLALHLLLFSSSSSSNQDLGAEDGPHCALCETSEEQRSRRASLMARLGEVLVPQQEQQPLGRFLDCQDSDKLLVFVHSRSVDPHSRNVVRNTWGSRRLYNLTSARVFFVIGGGSAAGSEDAGLGQQALQWEQDMHGDLIVADEPSLDAVDKDLKALVWLSWSQRQCPEVPVLIGVDAEKSFVDLVSLANNLKEEDDEEEALNATLVCKVEALETKEGDVLTFCAEDVFLLTNETRRQLLGGLNRHLGHLQSLASPTSSFVSSRLAPVAEVALAEVAGLSWTPVKGLSLRDSPIIPSSSDDSSLAWSDLLALHGIGSVPPVYIDNFTTTTHENFTLNSQNFCREDGIETLIVVHSAPAQSDFREVIRNTWGDARLFPLLRTRPLFFVGRSADPVIEQDLREESSRFGDVVQADYLDTYKNLTFKAVAWMTWVQKHCPNVSNLVKSDDDIVIDVFRLKKYLERMQSQLDMTSYRKFHCYYWRFGRIERDPNHKHYVPKSIFSARRYPAYCSGSAYILSTHISKILLDEFRRDPSYLWVDDVFVTGVLAKRAGVKHHSMVSSYAFVKDGLESDPSNERLVFSHLEGRSSHPQRYELWRKTLLKHGVAMLENGGYEISEVVEEEAMANVTATDQEGF